MWWGSWDCWWLCLSGGFCFLLWQVCCPIGYVWRYSLEVMCVIGIEDWGEVRDRYRRITRYCLTITVYLLVFVVYTSAPKARYNYWFEITSSSSARYFTRWFESRRLHRCRGIQIRYYVRLRTNNLDRRLPTCLRLAIGQNRMNLCRDDAP